MNATNVALYLGGGLAAWWLADAAFISGGNADNGLAFPFRMKSTDDKLAENKQQDQINKLKQGKF